MTLANPLALASFADLLQLTDVKFYPLWQQESSGSGSGETLYADRGPMLWQADATTGDLPHAEAEAIMALINSRAGGLKSLLLYNHKVPFPSTDPDGTIFGLATPVVGAITDRFHVAFTGFPAGYVVPLGTYFQVLFDTSRYYLGQFVEARTASGAGAIASVEVAPALPTSIIGGEPVTVIKPAAKFKIVPNSAYPSVTGALHSIVTFSAKQTYAA